LGDENLLVHGDNLVALKKLRAKFAGRIKCVYLDPPFNTGRTFVEYTDSLASTPTRSRPTRGSR
jgi:adenine-specific DNA-methyltransferase